MKIVIVALFVMLLLTGCSATNGGGPSGEFEIYRVDLEDGRELECISSSTYGGRSVLDCNWEELN